MLRSLSAACLVVCLTAASASAQHVDVLARQVDGQVGVALYDRTQTVLRERRAFSGRFDEFYAVNDPGFAALAGSGALPANTALEWDFMPMRTPDYGASTLLYWDGLGDTPDFGPTPTDLYEMSLFGVNATVAAADGAGDIVPGGVIDFTASNGSVHAHQYFFLDDNGDGTNNTLPDAGYYLIAMRLRIDGLERSDPFYMAWGTPDSNATVQGELVLPWVEQFADSLVLRGDHNFDGVVDAADYTVWRDGLGTTHTAADAADWVQNYGAAAYAPAGAISVPEPGCALLVTVAWLAAFSRVFHLGRPGATPNR